jgi:hypothetical protein
VGTGKLTGCCPLQPFVEPDAILVLPAEITDGGTGAS